MSTQMRVLVVDDHSLFRDGISSLLDAAGFEVVGQASDGLQGLEHARKLQPDLVLMDITMPGVGGLEGLKLIKQEFPEMQVVMLTVSDEDVDLFAAVRAGASGYLLKSLSAEKFIGMLEGISRGEAAITRQTAARLMAGFVESSQPEEKQAVILTERELEILQWVGKGLSNKALAQRLAISENTVKYHLRNIMQKMGVQNRTEAVTRAMQLELLQNPEESPSQ